MTRNLILITSIESDPLDASSKFDTLANDQALPRMRTTKRINLTVGISHG